MTVPTGQRDEARAYAPLRVSLAGGGTDLPAWLERAPGRVITSAIDRGVTVTVRRGGARPTGAVGRLLEAACDLLGVRSPIDLQIDTPVPPGTGLGSSSSLAVALLLALGALDGRDIDAEALAVLACTLEIDLLGQPIGMQDQVAAALGGMLDVRFTGPRSWVAERLALPSAALQKRLRLVPVPGQRDAGPLCASVAARLDVPRLSALHALCEPTRRAVEQGDAYALGALLHEGWTLKRALADGISSAEVEARYAALRSAGALGGKLLGAGAAGFLLVVLPDEAAALDAAFGASIGFPWRVDPRGARLLAPRGRSAPGPVPPPASDSG